MWSLRSAGAWQSLSTLAVLIGVSDAGVSRRDVSVPANLPGNWVYYGCYTDVGRTIDAAGYVDNVAMTDESCINFCSSRGYQFAGTEYYQECYCGNTLAPTAALVSNADCSYPCKGNASEACGGSSRLTLFHSPAPTGPRPNPGVNGWSHIGCYIEGTTGRALTHGDGTVANANMTVALCTSACHAAGYILAGVEYGGECYCDNSIQNGAVPAADGCTMQCNGNGTEICGGSNRLNIYDYLMSYPISSATSTRTSTSTTLVVSTTSSRISSTVSSSSISTRTTVSSISTATTIRTSTSTRASTSSLVSSSSIIPSSTIRSTTSTTVPAPTGMPSGWTYQGCWVDGAAGRIFESQIDDSTANTPQVCAQACAAKGFNVSGTEYGVQCFCGKYLINGATKADEAQCSEPCPGNPALKCGAGNRASVWSLGVPKVYAVPSPQTTGLDGAWTYQGCVLDNVNNLRTFSWEVHLFKDVMTPNLCLNRCAKFGYMAAGLEFGDECYCGDPANIATAGATFRPESECSDPCDGLPSALCGSGSRMTTYFWTGAPLYSWTFPQTPATAGQFQFLIDGVTVPLMTMQSVTGKVSFVSKGPGTGLGNETGAYELDLSVVGNFTQAWRPLHVRTDVFCSAGVILPDKAGRQLTVGGWAGASTFGTRLYWPDGSAGVWGTHDWQENQDEVSLQAERWYPTAMIMTNGSVLIVGGEACSNCHATPSLEILPYTGAPPLFMEWLNRTNPNNLYPFMAVLPSGGIFAGYWNEAIILDPVTFATRKTLPNMPGTVVDDLHGGRTYPQEGAAVLLPQRAPYTEPLGILICGGSTEGPGYALDTCVSTFPDAPNPTWTIERMPSRRVMPCIAPLPDGTYLIANGAIHGWAGYGLATKPNKNALLYDPSKPYGSRITVMANSTLARLYHSEAITLLDGRVLISGSDPTGDINTAPPETPQEYRVEVYLPPYLLTGKPRPNFTITNKDWAYGQANIAFNLGTAAQNGAITVTLLGAVSSTHGNSMGARTIMPAFRCTAASCTVDAPPNANICPPGWYQLHVLDGGVPAIGTYIRIGGDPAQLGNWPPYPDFLKPGM